MPKERFHILLAELSLQEMNPSWDAILAGEENRFAFRLGVMAPDVCFYDVPTFRLAKLGRSLHALQGDVGVHFVEQWLRERRAETTPAFQAWLLGVASHLIADGFWHPLIQEVVCAPDGICMLLGLSPKDCHHWLESDLEAYWLFRLGPEDGYIPFLRKAGGKEAIVLQCSRYFLEFVSFIGLTGFPPWEKIRRCTAWQAFLLRQFAAQSPWAKWRPVLLRRNITRYLGALICPMPDSILGARSHSLHVESLNVLFGEEIMKRAISLLSSRLRGLPTLS